MGLSVHWPLGLRRRALRRVAKRGTSGWRSATSRRGAGGGSCFAHASAVGYGLRPSRDCAAVLGAQGFVARSPA